MLTLKPRHAPDNGLAFWIALSLASILGCNTGDFYARFFGHIDGLPILIAAFFLTLLAEQRNGGDTKAFYWFAIIIVRTAATNLADFFAHGIGLVPALGALAALMLLAMALGRRLRGAPTGAQGLPVIDGPYWFTMLMAGTLGTALGDFMSDKTGLGVGGASLVLSALVAVLVAVRTSRAIAVPLSYWLMVVAIRTAGTAVGDFFAHLIGLWQSTLVFTVLLTAFLWKIPRRGAAVAAG
jgi:uncharacterized membrane-anchored protein